MFFNNNNQKTQIIDTTKNSTINSLYGIVDVTEEIKRSVAKVNSDCAKLYNIIKQDEDEQKEFNDNFFRFIMTSNNIYSLQIDELFYKIRGAKLLITILACTQLVTIILFIVSLFLH